MFEMLLSVVIPVYNALPYLDACVSSILRQDLDVNEYEVILVDDGSTDGSGERCDFFARQFSQVKSLHQPNGGQNMARLTGVKVSQGDFLTFVDSDDWLEDYFLFPLLKVMRENVDIDICIGSMKLVYSDGREKKVFSQSAPAMHVN